MEETVKMTAAVPAREWLKKNVTTVASYGGLIFCVLLFTIVTPIKGESIW